MLQLLCNNLLHNRRKEGDYVKKALLFALLIFLVFAFLTCDNVVGKTIKEIDDQTVNVILPTVVFETNGGSEVSSQTTKVIKNAPKTTREHYLFDGWYLDSSFKTLVAFPLTVEYDTTLYAKWLKIYDTAKANDICISGKSGYPYSSSLDISPSKFELEALAKQNLKLKITVSYDVYYQKRYDVLWDIGYAGAPCYEVYLLGEDSKGTWDEDVKTPSSSQTRTISMCPNASYFQNNIIKLTFSTNNVQNAIYISNIVITYECGK